MLYATLAPFLKTLMTSLALDVADPKFKAEWRDGKRAFVPSSVAASIVLSIPSSRETITVETLTKTTSPTETLSSKLEGQREFTLNVQARSYDLTYARWCQEYLERIRTRIQRRDVIDSMLALDLVCYERGPIIEVEGKEDGQALSIGNLDLFMRAGFEDAPQTGLNWIESLDLTSHVTDAGGTELERPAGNFTSETMPAT